MFQGIQQQSQVKQEKSAATNPYSKLSESPCPSKATVSTQIFLGTRMTRVGRIERIFILRDRINFCLSNFI
jgi:hypothetical protein